MLKEYYTGNGEYVVKSWAQMETEYGRTRLGINCPFTPWTREMEENLPVHRHIRVLKDCEWKGFLITEEMLLGPAFRIGEEVEVSDDGEKWVVREFMGYTFRKQGLAVNVPLSYFRHVRPIQKPTYKITATKDGEEIELKDVPQEVIDDLRGEI